MLTIQPHFTTKQYNTKMAQRPLHFKGIDEGEGEITEEFIRNKQAFYEEQSEKAEKIINNEKAPETLKKGMRFIKIISDGIWEGLAVLWGAKVGSKFVKGSTVKAANSKAAKSVAGGFKKVSGYIAKGFEKLSQSSLAKKAGELVEKLDNTKFGKYIVAAGKAVVNAVKSVVRFVKGKTQGTDIGATYDKVANGVSTTLGVGSGVAASYDTARKTNPPKENIDDTEDNIINDDDIIDDDDEVGGDE